MMRTDGLLSEYAPAEINGRKDTLFCRPDNFADPFRYTERCAAQSPVRRTFRTLQTAQCRSELLLAQQRVDRHHFVSDRTQSDRISGERGPAQGFGMGLVLGDKGPDDLPRGFGVVAGESRQSFEPANRILFRKTLLRGNPASGTTRRNTATSSARAKGFRSTAANPRST